MQFLKKNIKLHVKTSKMEDLNYFNKNKLKHNLF